MTHSDVHDPTRDERLARYVMNVHTGANEETRDKDELDLETLKKYVIHIYIFTYYIDITYYINFEVH